MYLNRVDIRYVDQWLSCALYVKEVSCSFSFTASPSISPAVVSFPCFFNLHPRDARASSFIVSIMYGWWWYRLCTVVWRCSTASCDRPDWYNRDNCDTSCTDRLDRNYHTTSTVGRAVTGAVSGCGVWDGCACVFVVGWWLDLFFGFA